MSPCLSSVLSRSCSADVHSSTAGITLEGRTGPDARKCDAVYKGSSAKLVDPKGMYRDVAYGIQRLVIPQTGWYKVTTGGAKGGRGINSDSYKPVNITPIATT